MTIFHICKVKENNHIIMKDTILRLSWICTYYYNTLDDDHENDVKRVELVVYTNCSIVVFCMYVEMWIETYMLNCVKRQSGEDDFFYDDSEEIILRLFTICRYYHDLMMMTLATMIVKLLNRWWISLVLEVLIQFLLRHPILYVYWTIFYIKVWTVTRDQSSHILNHFQKDHPWEWRAGGADG